MKDYLALCLKGSSTIPERKVMLEEKRKHLEEEMERIKESVAFLDWKMGFYDDCLAGRTEYKSNLIKTW